MSLLSVKATFASKVNLKKLMNLLCLISFDSEHLELMSMGIYNYLEFSSLVSIVLVGQANYLELLRSF